MRKGSTAAVESIVNKKQKIALIHVAKKAVGICDEDYEYLLMGAAGIDSAKYLEYEDQFESIMRAFTRLGFKYEKQVGKSPRLEWNDRWGCTDAQRAKIEVMWQTCARNKSERSLRAFIKRIAKVDHPAFLRPNLAGKVINALNTMMIKAGYDPETGKRIAP